MGEHRLVLDAHDERPQLEVGRGLTAGPHRVHRVVDRRQVLVVVLQRLLQGADVLVPGRSEHALSVADEFACAAKA